MGGFSFVSYQFTATFRTVSDEFYLFTDHEAGRRIHTGYFGDDFSSLFYIDHIAYMQIESFNDIRIMQRCALHYCARKLYRVEIGYRCYGAGSPYLIGYHVQAGQCAFSLKFIGNGPARRLGCEPKIPLLFEAVYFQYDSVCSNVQVFALYVPIVDKVEDFL